MQNDSSCKSTGILNIPNYNVYTQSVIEVDSRFGLYSGCTPDPDTGIFQCEPYSHNCWYNATGPSKLNNFSIFNETPGEWTLLFVAQNNRIQNNTILCVCDLFLCDPTTRLRPHKQWLSL